MDDAYSDRGFKQRQNKSQVEHMLSSIIINDPLQTNSQIFKTAQAGKDIGGELGDLVATNIPVRET